MFQVCLQVKTTDAFNLEEILNAITPDNTESQIHHPDHEFARYRRSRIPESVDYLEEDSDQANEDESSGEGEADENDADDDVDKNDDITDSGESDDGSSSGDSDDDELEKRTNIAEAVDATAVNASTANASNATTSQVVEQGSEQALKPDDFQIPGANIESTTKETMPSNETVQASNTTVEGSNNSSETVMPSAIPDLTNTSDANTTDATVDASNGNATENATAELNEAAFATQAQNVTPASNEIPVVPENKAETVVPAAETKPTNAESGKIDARANENIQALNSNLAAINTTVGNQDTKSEVVMFSEQEKQKNYTSLPAFNAGGAVPTAAYMGKADDQINANAKAPAVNATLKATAVNTTTNAKHQSENAAKRNGIKKKSEELMTAEEIVEDMDSEKEDEEESENTSASGSGSGSGNAEQALPVQVKSVKTNKNAKPVAKEKTASLSANEAAFISSMEADEESSGSKLEVTPESGSGSGENVEKALVAEINQMREKINESKKQAEKKETSKVQQSPKEFKKQSENKQSSKIKTKTAALNTQVPNNAQQNYAAVQNKAPAAKQAAKTGSYAQQQQQQQPKLQQQVPSQGYKQSQQQAAYTQQQQPKYSQQTVQSQPKQAPSKEHADVQHQTAATSAQLYSQNAQQANAQSETKASAKIQNAIESKADRAEKNKLRAAKNGGQAITQTHSPVQTNVALPQAQQQRPAQNVPAQAGKPIQANTATQKVQQTQANAAYQQSNVKAIKPAKVQAASNKNISAVKVQPKVSATPKTKQNKNISSDAYGEAADLLKTSSKIELKENDDNLPGATGDDITEEDLQKLQSISVNDAAGANENDFGDLMSSIGDKKSAKETKKSKQPEATTDKSPKAKSWTMVFNGTEGEGSLPGGYGDDYLEDGSSDEESGSGNEHAKSDIEMQIESSIGSSFESTMKTKRGKNTSGSGSGSGSGDEYESELLPGDYGSESPLSINEEGSGDDDDESGDLDFMSGNHASGSGKEIDQHIHALLQAHVEAPKAYQPERINVANATVAATSQGQAAPQPINYPSIQREYVSKAPNAPKLEQESTRPEQKSQQLDNDDEEVSGSGSGETGESSGHSNEGSGSEASFALPFVQPEAPKPRPVVATPKVGQLEGVSTQQSSAVQQAVAHVTQNILNNIRNYQANITMPATPADSRMIKVEDEKESSKQAAEAETDEDSGSGSASSGAAEQKSQDAASGNKKYDSDDDDDDEAEATPEEAETKEIKNGKQEEAGQRGQIEKSKESKAHKHEELQPQDEDDEEDAKPKYDGFTVRNLLDNLWLSKRANYLIFIST